MANGAYLDFVTEVIGLASLRIPATVQVSDFAPCHEQVKSSETMYHRVGLVRNVLNEMVKDGILEKVVDVKDKFAITLNCDVNAWMVYGTDRDWLAEIKNKCPFSARGARMVMELRNYLYKFDDDVLDDVYTPTSEVTASGFRKNGGGQQPKITESFRITRSKGAAAKRQVIEISSESDSDDEFRPGRTVDGSRKQVKNNQTAKKQRMTAQSLNFKTYRLDDSSPDHNLIELDNGALKVTLPQVLDIDLRKQLVTEAHRLMGVLHRVRLDLRDVHLSAVHLDGKWHIECTACSGERKDAASCLPKRHKIIADSLINKVREEAETSKEPILVVWMALLWGSFNEDHDNSTMLDFVNLNVATSQQQKNSLMHLTAPEQSNVSNISQGATTSPATEWWSRARSSEFEAARSILSDQTRRSAEALRVIQTMAVPTIKQSQLPDHSSAIASPNATAVSPTFDVFDAVASTSQATRSTNESGTRFEEASTKDLDLEIRLNTMETSMKLMLARIDSILPSTSPAHNNVGSTPAKNRKSQGDCEALRKRVAKLERDLHEDRSSAKSTQNTANKSMHALRIKHYHDVKSLQNDNNDILEKMTERVAALERFMTTTTDNLDRGSPNSGFMSNEGENGRGRLRRQPRTLEGQLLGEKALAALGDHDE